MERFTARSRVAGLAACSAMALAVLAGCSGHAPLASSGKPVTSGERAETALDSDVAKAEARVTRAPRNGAARADLAQAYLAAGRFESAATTFNDAATLGEDNARVGLGQALAYIGAGRNAEALQVLGKWRNEIPASDLGLAVALAGQPGEAVGLLSDALHNGDNTPKTRQNLAYAYALDGRWVEARVIASQDVPADQLDARLSDWASRGRPEQYQMRIAGLLGAPVRVDAGQPAALALNGAEQPARMASADVPPAPAVELPPVAAEDAAPPVEPAQQVAMVPASLPAQPVEAPRYVASAKFVSQPKVRPLGPVHTNFVAMAGQPTHLVQLGSFSSMEGAKRAWGIFVARNPSLKDHQMRITEAQVQGKRFFRVAAEGFNQGSARTLCANVRQRGGACLAYAEKRPLPGVVPSKAVTGPMLAQR